VRRKSGIGSIYLRGDVYWIKYHVDGKPYRESSKSTRFEDAKDLLRKRSGEIDNGNFAGTAYLKTTFEDLMALVKEDYRLYKRKSSERLNYSVAHLEKEFKGGKATNITIGRIRKYASTRQAEGAENATDLARI
jgi:hypothetical protein